jgi:hypothetical protein
MLFFKYPFALVYFCWLLLRDGACPAGDKSAGSAVNDAAIGLHFSPALTAATTDKSVHHKRTTSA